MNEAIKLAQQALAEKREAGEAVERKSWTEKARERPKSLRLAINAKCWECSSEQREEIRHCPCTDCPLHGLRPYK